MSFTITYKNTYTVPASQLPSIEEFLDTLDPVDIADYPDGAGKTPLEVYLDKTQGDWKGENPNKAKFISETRLPDTTDAHGNLVKTLEVVWESEAAFNEANPTPVFDTNKPEEEGAPLLTHPSAFDYLTCLYNETFIANVTVTTANT